MHYWALRKVHLKWKSPFEMKTMQMTISFDLPKVSQIIDNLDLCKVNQIPTKLQV